MGTHQLGAIILLLVFPNQLPAQIDRQSGGPEDYFVRLLLVDVPGMTDSSA